MLSAAHSHLVLAILTIHFLGGFPQLFTETGDMRLPAKNGSIFLIVPRKVHGNAYISARRQNVQKTLRMFSVLQWD